MSCLRSLGTQAQAQSTEAFKKGEVREGASYLNASLRSFISMVGLMRS